MDDLRARADEYPALTRERVAAHGSGAARQVGPLHLVTTGLPIAVFDRAYATATTPDPAGAAGS